MKAEDVISEILNRAVSKPGVLYQCCTVCGDSLAWHRNNCTGKLMTDEKLQKLQKMFEAADRKLGEWYFARAAGKPTVGTVFHDPVEEAPAEATPIEQVDKPLSIKGRHYQLKASKRRYEIAECSAYFNVARVKWLDDGKWSHWLSLDDLMQASKAI